MTELHIDGLYSYPIKSCAPLEVGRLAVTEHGLEHDREWMVARPNGTFLTQRQFPELALVRTAVDDNYLYINAPETGRVRVPLERPDTEHQDATNISIFKKDGSAIDQSTEASELFSEYLNKPVKLMRSVGPRPIKPECRVEGASDAIRLADGFPLLLTSSSSLGELNKAAPLPISMDRFRPNIVVQNDDLEAYDEDYWRELKIGSLRTFVVRACARCPIPDVNQRLGERSSDKRASVALKATRSGIDPVNNSEGVFFGQNLVHVFEPGATIALGDKITVVERSDERNVQLAI